MHIEETKIQWQEKAWYGIHRVKEQEGDLGLHGNKNWWEVWHERQSVKTNGEDGKREVSGLFSKVKMGSICIKESIWCPLNSCDIIFFSYYVRNWRKRALQYQWELPRTVTVVSCRRLIILYVRYLGLHVKSVFFSLRCWGLYRFSLMELCSLPNYFDPALHESPPLTLRET